MFHNISCRCLFGLICWCWRDVDESFNCSAFHFMNIMCLDSLGAEEQKAHATATTEVYTYTDPCSVI